MRADAGQRRAGTASEPGAAPTEGTGTPRRWQVPTLQVDVDTALALLLREEPPDGWAYAAHARSLAALAGFADDLARRGRVLPTVRAVGGTGQAVWVPVLTGADAQWLRAAASTTDVDLAAPTHALVHAEPVDAGGVRRDAAPVPGPRPGRSTSQECSCAAARRSGGMREQLPQGGRIIDNGSLSARVPRPGAAAYTASEHAVTGRTKATALAGRPYGSACGQIDVSNAATDLTPAMGRGVP